MNSADIENVDGPRRSMLVKLTSPQGSKRSSPESMRQSFMVLISLVAAGISGYYTVILGGTGPARIILALIFAGWLALLIHTVRSSTSARKD